MSRKFFVGQEDDEGIMIIGGADTHERAEIEKNCFNKGTFSFRGQKDPNEYPYNVYYAEEESGLEEG